MSKDLLFTSDLHFLHKNVINHCNRPWTYEDQTEEIINRWNAKATDNSLVYHLGDFIFAGTTKFQQFLDIIAQLKGKIHFITGNHCTPNFWKMVKEANLSNVVLIDNYHEIFINKQRVVLFHYPISNWNGMHYGSIMLHGHEHGVCKRDGKILDVGIDNHPDRQLFTWDEIKDIMDKKEIYIPEGLRHNNMVD